ncbi:hypothetical protein GA0074692_5818 [Micromonospora pallida]|uniref:Uncharacterized protein n=1 Tax=Micromonospora pallida TaxID=145854 RepID=A0A1C6TFP8_9ACTN|nr:hypothetical protein [Micromonospora pallida]SCL40477.1 hypothetical protein GA0074692_5818 [Micromonospora pallida]
MGSRWRTVRRHLAAALLALTMGAVILPAPAQAVDYPGGRRIYSVALGAIPAAGAPATGPVWVRLATYYFFGDGTVTESFWYWNRATVVGAAGSGVRTTGCAGHDCEVRTAAGFQPGGLVKSLSGTYTNSGDSITITWSGDVQETWRVSEPASDLARLDFVSSNYGVTVGWGFGSSASNDAYTPVSSIPLTQYTGRYAGYSGSVGAAGPSGMDLRSFSRCNGNCLSWLSPPTATCSSCPNGATSSPIRYYLAGAGRRNFYEHWCTCLTSSTCYTGGSHRKPQLQVIGDNGTFHGWVGVEASNSTANAGYFAVHFHVNV